MNGFETLITNLLNPAYTLFLVGAFLYFLWGGLMFIININDPDKKTVGKSHLLWGLVGLFIIYSVGAIMKWFNTILGGFFT
ncbi:MAG: hypothetical protein JWN37_299 [Candidatus Nomurabacteria bacterium]|nr:hypothetical protein [Candidatus Nomurabacteria bacterium]